MNRHLNFSNFKDREFSTISRLLCSLFKTNQSEIERLYEEIINDFDKDGWPSHSVSRDFFVSEDHKFREVYDSSPAVSVDLPSTFELADGGENKPTVVILGQDSKSNQDFEDIWLGTPYGLHHKGSREVLGSTKLYFEMIYVLLELGYRVYLTDIYKIWVCDPKRLYYGIRLPIADQKKFLDILEPELVSADPVAIVTWGKDPARGFSQIGLDIHHLKFPHPSGAANGAWKKLMNQPPTRANKLAYWKSVVSEALPNKL